MSLHVISSHILRWSALALVAGCASGDPCATAPGSGGFFGGLSSMTTGSGEACLGQMNANARLAEDQQRLQQRQTGQKLVQASATSSAVRSAEDRLRKLNATIRSQRDDVARLRRERGAGETESLQAQADALERNRAAAAQNSSGPTPAQVRQLEQDSRDLDAAIRRLGSS